MDSLENTTGYPVAEPGTPPFPARSRIRIIRDGILAFVASIGLTLVLVITGVVVALLAGAMPMNSAQGFTPTAGWIIALLFAGELPFAGFAMFLRWRYRRKGHLLKALFEGTTVSTIAIGMGTGICMAVFGFLHAALATMLFGKASSQSMEEILQMLFSLKDRPVMVTILVFSIAVLAPFCEEFFFRGAIFSSVRSTQQARAGAMVSALLFAIAHGNPPMFTYYVIFGLTMCWLLSKTGTMAAPIAAHMTVNTVACIAVLLSPSAIR
jgi:membrane protease YdiL (CAAX protease family)